MRAKTKGKRGMGKRFAVVIGVAAVGVMALGAQTGAQTQAPTPPGQAPVTCNSGATGGTAIVAGTRICLIEGTPGNDVIRCVAGVRTSTSGA